VRRVAAIGLALCAFALGACGGDDAPAAADAGPGVPDANLSPDANPLVVARPYTAQVPDSYDASKPTPLVVALHGYAVNSFAGVRLFDALNGSKKHGYLVAYPDGLPDSQGKEFWNATDACCNYDNNPVDDVAYLSAVIDDMQAQYNVDPRRIYVVGHSNGAFMAHRLACDIGGRLAGVVTMSGMTWKDPTKCPAEHPVNVLQIHGTIDSVIAYEGSDTYPSAAVTVATWAAKNGCTGALVDDGAPFDLVSNVDGAETQVQAYEGCPAGGAVDFWTINGADHLPLFDPADFETRWWAWVEAHPKP
jgi:polyhydroxybutyrate depolymerase